MQQLWGSALGFSLAAAGAMFNQILTFFVLGWGTGEGCCLDIVHKTPLLLIGKTPKGMEEGTTKIFFSYKVEHSQTYLLAKLAVTCGPRPLYV